MQVSPLGRVARLSALLSAVALIVATALGAAVGSTRGAYGAALGIGLPTLFFGITLVVALATMRRSGTTLGAAIMGSWLVKLVLLIAVLAILKPLTFYDRPVFATALLGWTAVLLGLEVRVIKRTQQYYVEPGTRGGATP